MKMKYVKRVISLILSIAILTTSFEWNKVYAVERTNNSDEKFFTEVTPDSDATTDEEISEELEVMETDGNFKELPEQRTPNSTTFVLSDNQYRTDYYASDVRYEDENGNLIDFDSSLKKLKKNEKTSEGDRDLSGYKYENIEGEKKNYFPEKISEDTPVLMENDDYAIKITPCIEDKAIAFDDVSIDKEEIENIYGDTEEKIISASYESDEEVFQYESENNGIKESIILNEYQGNNVWKFKLQLEGGIQAKKYNKGILFKDSKTDEIVGCIEPPYMNDASNDNYSEKIEYEIQKLEEDSESVTYEFTMTVDEEYLTSKDTKYPVVIDPTYTWTGNSGITDVYVLGAANYQSKNNYNNNANTIMTGKLTSKGIVRTYLSFSGLADKIKDKSVESLKLSLYETGSGKSNVSVCAYKTSSSYSAKTLTWTNRPGYNTLLDTQTSTGKSAKEKVFDITAYGRSVSKGNNDFGIMLRASDESTANVYAEFYGTRSSKSSYLPKVSVVYYDVPTTPDTISVSPKYVKKGSPLTVSWTGIKSYSLSEIQYRICKFDAANKSEIGTVSSYADNASIGKTESGSATISAVSSLADGTYKIVIRGKDKNGYVGVGKGSSFTIDGTKPTLSSVVISPSTSSTNYSDYAPSISFSGVSDVNFERVEYKVGTTGSYTTLATTTSGKYTLPEGLFTKTQAYKIYVRSVDKAGNVSNEVVNTYYYKDYVSEISDYDVDKIQIRETASGKTRLKWSCKEKGTLPADIYYQVYRSTSSSCDINSANLVADNIKDFTTVVYNGTSNVKYYYRVRAVRNNKSGTKTYGASSPLVNSVSIDDELSLRNGLIDILEYDEIEASQGVGYVEKTTGNFTYTENDIMLPCADMPYGISRYYNSNSRLTGSFGNWTSVWDCRIEEDRNNIVYFRDYTGAIYTLINRGDGTYTSDIVENLSLTRCNKSITKIVKNGSGKKAIRCDCAYQFENPDNSAFYFNKKGDLLLIENNNGTFQALEYNDYGVVSKIWASNGPSLELKYSQTSLAMGKPLIERINLPNGIYFSYVYEDGKLIKAIFYSNNISKYGASHYEYSYNSNGKLYYLFDPYCNRIVVSYSNNRVSQIVYPDREKVCYEYQPANYKTTVKEYSPESVLLRSEITTYSPGYGMPERHEESDGNTIINTYRGTKANSSRMKVDYNTISGDVIYDNQIYVSENIEYDSEGRISKIIDSAGNNISYTYCTTKGLTHLPQRVVTTDTSGKVVSDKTYRYNYKGDIIEEKENVDNVKVNLQYDNQGNIIKEEGYIKDKEAYISEYEYDENGEEIKSDEISGTVALSEETRYDVMGNVTYTKDDTGLETYYTYDGYGRPESTRFIKGNTVDVEYTYYNINGRLARKVNIDGSITQYEYDCMNRVIKETYTKGGQSRQYVYEYGYTKDSIKIYNGKPDGITYKTAYYSEKKLVDNGTTHLVAQVYYDTRGNVIREVSNGIRKDYTYDNERRVVTTFTIGNSSSNESEGKLALTLYDKNGNVYSNVINPYYDGTHYRIDKNNTIYTLSTYDSNGNITSQTDEKGNTVSYKYDNSMQLTSVICNEGKELQVEQKYTYDEVVGNELRSKSINALGGYYQQMTNTSGQLISESDIGTDGKQIVIKYEYNNNGDNTKAIYGDQSYDTYEYDNLYRLSKIKKYNKSGSYISSTCYSYDINDNVVKTIDYNVVSGKETPYRYTYYEYDAYDRLSSYCEINSNIEPTSEKINESKITYSYDINDNIISTKYPKKLSPVKELRYTYNLDNWLVAVTMVISTTSGDKSTKLREYEYNNMGELREVKEYTNPLNCTSEYTSEKYQYDAFGRITAIKYIENSTKKVRESYEYTYDKSSNITSERIYNDYPENVSDKINEERTYTYDSLNRLVSTSVSNKATGAVTKYTYTYDKLGNRTSQNVGGEITTYTYDGLGQMISSVTVNKNNQTTSKCVNQYDAKGNLTKTVDSIKNEVIIYEYDLSNQLVCYRSYKDGKEILRQENSYDGYGNRISKSENGKKTYYYYEDGNVLYTTNEYDTVTSINVVGDALGYTGTIRFENSQPVYYTYNKDIRTSISGVISYNGKGVVTYSYDDFGNTKIKGNANFYNEICYTSAVYDETTSHYYMAARYYDSATGRFITKDTYRGSKTEYGTWNLYTYCANNPLKYVDPSGHIVKEIKDCFEWCGKKVKKGAKKVKNTYKKVKKCVVNKINYIIEEIKGNKNLQRLIIGTVIIIGTGLVVAATGGSGLVVTGQIFSFALKSGATCAVINGVTYRVVKGGNFKDFKREVCSGFAFGYEAGAVIGTVKFIKASSTVKKSGKNAPYKCNISSKQFGKKWGKHKTDYPDLSMDEYKNLIDDVFKSPDKIIQDFENNEFLYLKEIIC